MALSTVYATSSLFVPHPRQRPPWLLGGCVTALPRSGGGAGHQAIAGFLAGIGCAGDDSVDAVGEGSLAREEVVIAVHGKAQEQLIPQARVEHRRSLCFLKAELVL